MTARLLRVRRRCAGCWLAVAAAAGLVALGSPAAAGANYEYPIGNAGSPFSFEEVATCPTVSFCVALDASNQVITGDPTGGTSAWSRSTPIALTGQPYSISCPTASFCAVADTYGDVATSTDPAGGASAWSTTQVLSPPPGVFILDDSVSCPTSTLCVLVGRYGNVFVSTDPTGGASAWSAVQVPGAQALAAVACPTSSFCVIADDAGQIVTSTDPTGGAAAWRTTARLRPANPLYPYGFVSISCPTVSFCAAADGDGGNVATSADPGGGSGAWRVAHVGSAFDKLVEISCASAHLCYTQDSDSYLFASIDPLAGSRAWVPAGYLGLIDNFGWTLSCPAVKLCVGIGLGDARLFTAPSRPAVLAAEPQITGTSISGVARDAPRLRLTVTSGVPPGEAVKSIAIDLPAGLSFKQTSGAIRVLGSTGRPVGFVSKLSLERVTIVLARPATSHIAITISPAALTATRHLANAVKHHKLRSIHLRMTVTDTRHARTALSPSVRAS